MTAHPPSDPAAEAVSALREALARDIEDPIHGRDSRSLALETAEGLILGPLAPLLADIAALRTERDEARCVGEANARAADANLEAYEAAEARADALAAEVERLKKGIEAFVAGDYTNPRSYRPGKCPHGINYWEECASCNDAALTALLDPAARALKTEGASDPSPTSQGQGERGDG